MSETFPTSKFIVLEGIDSQALQEQAEGLYGWLREDRVRIHLTREPSDGPFGSQIRLILDERLVVDKATLALFFATDRMDHLRKRGGILDRLESGEHVICIRYYLSSFAYQALDVDLGWLRATNAKCHQPDLTLFIDTPIDACMEHIIDNNLISVDRLEQKREELERVRANYFTAIEVLRQEGQEIVLINGNRPAAAIERDIQSHVTGLMRQGIS